jgi:hypothetical protein
MPARPELRVVALLLLASMATVAGCGRSTPLTHGEFTRRASRVCDAANRRVGTPVRSLNQPDAATAMLNHVVDVQRDTLARLHHLVPPARDGATVERWLALHAQLVAELDSLRADLHHKQAALARVALAHAVILARRARALASADGIRPCRTPMPRPG